MTTRRPASGLPRLALGCWIVALLAAGTSSPADTSTFGDVVEVELVDVEVWVTDRDGDPVTGLGRDAFALFEDGDPVDLAAFFEIRSGRPAPETERPESLAPKEVALRSSESTASLLPSVVLFVDQLNMDRPGMKRMTRAIRDLVEKAGVPAERILLLRHDGALVTELPFGSSAEQLRAVLDGLEASKSAVGIRPDRAKRRTAMELEREWEIAIQGRNPCLIYPRRAGVIIDGFVQPAIERYSSSIRHLVTVSRFLAGRPGPKTLVYMGDALEVRPGSSFVRLVDEKCPQQRDVLRSDMPVLSAAYEELTHQANANRVTLYTLQSSGLSASVLGGPESRYRVDSGIEFEMRTSGRSGLGFLAERTGGRLLPSRNRVAPVLETAVRETESYYSLAYAPDHGAEDADHRLEVEVEVEGRRLKIRHRESYRHKSSTERMADLLQSALHLGIMSNPLEARLGSAGFRASEDGEGLVASIRLMVPVDSAVFLPSAEGDTARLRVQVVAMDEQNDPVLTRQLEFSFPRERVPEDADFLTLPLDLTLGAGRFVIGLAVRDRASGETSYVATTVGLDPAAAEPARSGA